MSNVNHLAFVCPRFAEGPVVGGAETLLRRMAECMAASGRKVSILTTCAESHFTWANAIPPGTRRVGNLEVIFFPVDQSRDEQTFLRLQTAISRGSPLSEDDERLWMANSVHSSALYEHLKTHEYDRIIVGPYLFGLTYAVAHIVPERTLLVPCLHDEPFAYLKIMHDLFKSAAGYLFNSVPEQELANRIFKLPANKCSVVGMGLDPYEADPHAFAARHNIKNPYILYSGRREVLKGTPLLIDYWRMFRMRTRKDIDLVLTGSGPVEPPADMKNYVHDVGVVSEAEKKEAMAGATVFCHPSVNESFGIVLLEAWLAGVPALVHAGSAVLRYQCRLAGGGLWFSSYPEFEEEMLLLLQDETLRRQLGSAGKAYVRRMYSWARVEQLLLNALEHLGCSGKKS